MKFLNKLKLILALTFFLCPRAFCTTFTDTNWTTVGNGRQSAYGDGFVCSPAGVYFASGRFSLEGASDVWCLAQWNGTAWSALGPGFTGIDQFTFALTCDRSSNLYAGGTFTNDFGFGSATNVARWNGSSWSTLGAGLNCAFPGNPYNVPTDAKIVAALVIDNSGQLYAGGKFTDTGGLSINHIAQWNGTNWLALGSGLDGMVNALACDDSSNLFAGGSFTNAGGASALNIAKWNGSSWSPLGSGLNGTVYSLAWDHSSNLYAGGSFTNTASTATYYIARWNGVTWSALGSGFFNGMVYSLACDNFGSVYAGGTFTSNGATSVKHIAQWNGGTWLPLASGINGSGYTSVNSLAFDSMGQLLVSGNFTTAGTNAAANNLAVALIGHSSYNLSLAKQGNTNIITAHGTPNHAYALDLSTNFASPTNWIPQSTNTTSNGLLTFTNMNNANVRFYRTRHVP